MAFWKKLVGGLSKTAGQVSSGLKEAVGLSGKLDAAAREALEDVLLQADVGVKVAVELIEGLRGKLPGHFTEGHMKDALAALMAGRLKRLEGSLSLEATPTVVLVVGVNGSGKTTTIGKLAALWAKDGKKILVAAGDTFRAGATEQVAEWATRAKAVLVDEGGDAAAVAYKAVERGLKDNFDVVLIDTAGRLPNRTDLMAELGKMRRVIQKLLPEAPHHTLLVLDGTQGQAVLRQVETFGEEAGVTGLVVTKLDSSAKAGFLLALAGVEKVPPVVYLGVGEKLDDLGPFEAEAFAKGIVGAA